MNASVAATAKPVSADTAGAHSGGRLRWTIIVACLVSLSVALLIAFSTACFERRVVISVAPAVLEKALARLRAGGGGASGGTADVVLLFRHDNTAQLALVASSASQVAETTERVVEALGTAGLQERREVERGALELRETVHRLSLYESILQRDLLSVRDAVAASRAEADENGVRGSKALGPLGSREVALGALQRRALEDLQYLLDVAEAADVHASVIRRQDAASASAQRVPVIAADEIRRSVAVRPAALAGALVFVFTALCMGAALRVRPGVAASLWSAPGRFDGAAIRRERVVAVVCLSILLVAPLIFCAAYRDAPAFRATVDLNLSEEDAAAFALSVPLLLRSALPGDAGGTDRVVAHMTDRDEAVGFSPHAVGAVRIYLTGRSRQEAEARAVAVQDAYRVWIEMDAEADSGADVEFLRRLRSTYVAAARLWADLRALAPELAEGEPGDRLAGRFAERLDGVITRLRNETTRLGDLAARSAANGTGRRASAEPVALTQASIALLGWALVALVAVVLPVSLRSAGKRS